MELLLKFSKNFYQKLNIKKIFFLKYFTIFKLTIIVALLLHLNNKTKITAQENNLEFQNLFINKTYFTEFLKEKNKILEDISFAKNKEEKYPIYLTFLEFLFRNQYYEECLDLYEFIQKYFQHIKLDVNIKYQFFFAVSLILKNKYFQAREELQNILEQSTKYSEEILMWYNYALSMNKNTEQEANFVHFVNLQEQIKKHYPKETYLKLQTRFLKILFDHGAFEQILSMNIIEEDTSLFFFYLAKYAISKNREKLIEELNNLNSSNDIELLIKNNIKLLEIKLEDETISLNQAISKLKSMNYIALGHPIRFNLLKKLSFYYKKNNQLEQVLSINKYLEYYFENLSYEISSQRENVEYFIKIFTEEKTSSWNKLLFFLQYKDMVPLGVIGNRIVSKITQAFIDLNLIHQAIELLEHQIKFKLKDKLKFQSTIELVNLYIQIGEIEESLNLIHEIELPKEEFQNYQTVLALKAKIYLLLNQHDKVLNILDELDKEYAVNFQKEIFFKTKNYEEFIKLYNNYKNNFTNDTRDKFQRAISYFILKQEQELKALYQETDKENKLVKLAIELFINYLSINNKEDIQIFDKLDHILNQFSNNL